MHITLVDVWVRPEHVDSFRSATLANHMGSRSESGNMRFDVLRQEDDPTHFVLVEVYATAEDAAAHKQTEHYKQWRETVAPMMARDRQGTRYEAIAPNNEAAWSQS